MIEIAALKLAAGKVAGILCASLLSKPLATKAERSQIKLCVEGLCEQWLMAVLGSLQAIGYEEVALRDLFSRYYDDLETFVKDKEIAEELLKPLSETSSHYQLDSDLLETRWQELGLQVLPEDFDMYGICRLYIRLVKKQGIISIELRGLYLAQLAQDSANYLQAIRGHWPDFDLDRYKERLTTRYKTLDLSALTLPARDDMETSILLQDVFIPQSVKENCPPRELPKELWQRLQQKGDINDLPADLVFADSKRLQENWVQQSPKPVLAILDKRKLVILGDPGSGKSSLVRYLLLSCLTPPKSDTGTSANWLEPLKGHLPLLIELRSYIAAVSDKHCDNFIDYFHYLGKSEGYGLNHLDLKRQLKNSPALILFDGLDEVFNLAQREKVSQEIIGFGHDYPKARILVTSRIVGYEGTALRHAEFSEYTLQDLDSKQIPVFAQGWFALVFRHQPQEIISRILRIEQAIEHSPAIAQLAGNPLLLTIIAIIAKHQELPRERVLLYDHAVKVLCHHWEVTGHKINDTPTDFMRDHHKLELLRRVASKMQEVPDGLSGNVIHADDLQNEIESYLSQRWQLSAIEATRIGRAMIEQLRARNFILCFYGISLYGFVHRTFLEYFCADEIKLRFGRRDLSGGITLDELKALFLEHYRDDTWHEILRLICGMVDAEFAGQLIDAILPSRDSAFEEGKALTLAIQCLAEVDDLTKIPETSRQTLDCLCGWFESKERVIVNKDHEMFFEKNALLAIERIGKNWSGRENYLSWITSKKKRTFSFSGSYSFGRMVSALWGDYPEIEEQLITLTKKHEISVRHMSFDALARCFKSSTKKLLKEQLQVNSGNDVCIWTLTKHYRNEPDTYPLIKQCLQGCHSNVRQTAIRALAEHYRDEPDAYPLIKQCLQGHHSKIRQTAIRALAEHYRDEPDVYPLIRQSLQDGQGDVRQATIRALAEHYRDEPDTYPLIRLSLQDGQGDVRQEAIWVLAEHYRDEPDTYPLIRLSLQDGEGDVRQAAIRALADHYRSEPDTYPLIRLSLQDGQDDVRQEAIWLLVDHYRGEPDTYPLIRQSLQDGQGDVRQMAIWALAEHYRDEPDTYPLIRQSLQDGEGDVRQAAIRALAEHYRDEPDVYPLIRQSLQDGQGDVRQATIRELAEHYRDEPDVYPLIRQSLQDGQGDVRQEAIRALAGHYRSEPDVYPLIRRFLQDRHSDVRQTVIWVLVEYYRDEADVYPLIKQCLQDEQDDVRKSAVGAFSLLNYYGGGIENTLLSLDLDSHAPWLDPFDPISNSRVEQAAEQLDLSPDIIRQSYEEITGDLLLKLEWRLSK